MIYYYNNKCIIKSETFVQATQNNVLTHDFSIGFNSMFRYILQHAVIIEHSESVSADMIQMNCLFSNHCQINNDNNRRRKKNYMRKAEEKWKKQSAIVSVTGDFAPFFFICSMLSNWFQRHTINVLSIQHYIAKKCCCWFIPWDYYSLIIIINALW